MAFGASAFITKRGKIQADSPIARQPLQIN
jgi:hypothetical protein